MNNNWGYTGQNVELKRGDGELLHINCTVTPLRPEQAEGVRLPLELQPIEYQLAATREENLIEQQKASRELIRNLAHEIKNPLGGIRGAAQLLEYELGNPSHNLVLAVFFLSMGRVADKYGQKRVFMFGLVTFTLFSLLCGFAPNIEWLIAFRAGQGVGGAALLTISLAIVLGAFPRRQQGMAVGIWGALGTAAAAVGPTLGGVLVTYGHWSWIFFVNIPIGIVAVVVCAHRHPRARPQGAGRGRHRHPRHA